MVFLGNMKEAAKPQHLGTKSLWYLGSALPVISEPGSLHIIDRYREYGHLKPILAITGVPAPILFLMSFIPLPSKSESLCCGPLGWDFETWFILKK